MKPSSHHYGMQLRQVSSLFNSSRHFYSHTKRCQVQSYVSFMENEMATTNDFVSSKVSSPSGRRTAQAVRYATAEKVIGTTRLLCVPSRAGSNYVIVIDYSKIV